MADEGFLTDARTAELFFRFCSRYKINTQDCRVAVLRELTKRKKTKYLRDVNEYTQGKRTLKIGFKPKEK